MVSEEDVELTVDNNDLFDEFNMPLTIRHYPPTNKKLPVWKFYRVLGAQLSIRKRGGSSLTKELICLLCLKYLDGTICNERT